MAIHLPAAVIYGIFELTRYMTGGSLFIGTRMNFNDGDKPYHV